MNYLERATDEAGYPAMDFEAFYQQGISCFVWRLPKPLVRQAFKRVCADLQAKGNAVAMWQVRAFVYGLSGRYQGGTRKRMAPEGYQWPSPPDRSWETIVCVYPNGDCELDFVHPVSRMFWSDGNGFLALPTDDFARMGRWWFEEMGFEIMVMQPMMQTHVTDSVPPHLKLV